MSYNGSGTFQINTSGQPVVAGTVISSTAFNALTADLATGLSTAITKDGQTTTTARIPFAAGISSTLTTDSSSVSTGSIITAGGLGVAKAVYVGTTLNVAGATTAASGSFTSLSDSGNLTFTGTGNRITGDFSNATFANRVAFQTSTTNTATTITVLPNGTSTTSQVQLYSNSDPTNSSRFTVAALSTEATIRSDISGTGTYLPMTLHTGSSERVRVDTSGSVGIGTTAPGYRLEVKGPAATAGQLSIHDGAGDTVVSGTNAASLLFQCRDSSIRTLAEIDGVHTTTNGTAGAMVFQTRISDVLAERMRIDASANLQFNSGYGSVAVAYGCRAWCQYNASRTIIGSANITSITVNGTGDSTLNFTTAMPDANYSAVATTNEDGGTAKFCNATQPSTANIRVVTYTLAGVTTNNTYNFVAVFR